MTEFSQLNHIFMSVYSLTGVVDFAGASVLAPNIIIVNNNPPDNNPAQLGNSLVFTLSGINIV